MDPGNPGNPENGSVRLLAGAWGYRACLPQCNMRLKIFCQWPFSNRTAGPYSTSNDS